MLKVGIVGVTGYTGLELLRLLQHHPNVTVTHLFSQQFAGESSGSHFPSCEAVPSSFEAFDPDSDYDFDCLFLAVPHATTHEYMHKLAKHAYKIVDLSADFRLNDAKLFESYYSSTHQNPDLLNEVPYGIPELYADSIAHANIVANPGCYSTTAILGLMPLCAEAVVSSVIIDAKSGVTGAGKSLKRESLYCEVNEHISSYATNEHRHQAELSEHLAVPVVFSPHLIPMQRGILCSSYVQTTKPFTKEQLVALYKDFYDDCPFVTINSGSKASTQGVVGSNRCDITLSVVNDTITIFSATDNLIKGAAGQAIQNFNVMFGLDQTLSLPIIGQSV